jgi:hypothetical protein
MLNVWADGEYVYMNIDGNKQREMPGWDKEPAA